MKRSDLEHVVRAAAKVVGVTDLLVLGSQSILGSHPEWELPSAATRSVEADLAVDVELAHLDPHDLWAAKAAAGRPKDRSFCAALVGAGLVDRGTCLARVGGLPPDDARRAMVVLHEAWSPS